MKRIKFLVDVPDKYNKEQYKRNQVKKFEDKRADEILKARRANGTPYAVLVEEVETATKKVKAETAVKKTRKVKSIEIDLDKGTVKEEQ